MTSDGCGKVANVDCNMAVFAVGGDCGWIDGYNFMVGWVGVGVSASAVLITDNVDYWI